MTEQNIFNATVIERTNLHDELAVIKIRPNTGQIEKFKAGQFCTLGLPAPVDPNAADNPRRKGPKMIRRAYSIASSPKTEDHLEVFVVLVAGGKLTTKLWDCKEGDQLFMDPRLRGEFTLDPIPDGKDLVMISTGTGLAPFMSMMRTYKGTNRWRRLVMIHGVRTSKDLGYREELEKTAAEDDSIFYLPVCSREDDNSDWQGLSGRVHVALKDEVFYQQTGFHMTAQDTHLFMCGNPAMITSVQEEFEAKGFVTASKKAAGNIHFERYW